ncbi:MAG: ABC transporter permease [Chloroflexota bacterium]
MIGYTVRRLVWGAGVLAGVALVTFVLRYLVPADPARIIGGIHATPGVLAGIRHRYGFDQPLIVQFVRYMAQLVHGDLGPSLSLGSDVTAVLLARAPLTLELAVAGLLVELLVGIPLGVMAALRHRALADRLAIFLALCALSTPSFWFGPVLLTLFAVHWAIFPAGGADSATALVLPALTLGLAGAAWYTRLMRASMLDVLHSDYIRTARAKGLSWPRVIVRHALRNAATPVITQIGLDMAYFLGGVVVVETVFGWPGIGQAAAIAIANDDPNLIMGTVLVSAVAVVLANLAVDLGYTLIDPRVRLDR